VTHRVRVEHVSRYSYATPVLSSYNEVRLTPLTTTQQLVLDSRIEVEPPAPLFGYVDYWGAVVHSFDLHRPHEALVITARSVVETGGADLGRPGVTADRSGAGAGTGTGGGPAGTAGWEGLRHPTVLEAHCEYLAPTPRVPADARLAAVAGDLAGGAAPAEAAGAVVAWVGATLRYVPGTTQVHTSAVEAWELGEGVCQDFAHLTLAILRAMGIPARYCSGYVHPGGEAAVGEAVPGESHAWVEYWCGDWVSVDPTAGGPTGDHHVLVARGRDYSDVTPVKGIFHGGPASGLDVGVTLTRLA
jgi:transglutaminase-like putative cysteine protease